MLPRLVLYLSSALLALLALSSAAPAQPAVVDGQVRGGDVTETKTLLDQATVHHPYRYESPAGGSFGALLFAGRTVFALGFLLGALVLTARTAQSIGTAPFFSMLFLSGAAIPQFLFPDWLKTASLALPLTHTTRLLQDAWLHGQWNGTAALVLAGMGLASTAVAAWSFRWT